MPQLQPGPLGPEPKQLVSELRTNLQTPCLCCETSGPPPFLTVITLNVPLHEEKTGSFKFYSGTENLIVVPVFYPMSEKTI